MELAELKKAYSAFEKKHNLPSFKELNEDFEIEKIDAESECLLRVVRKTMMEKIINSMNFLDLLINPINPNVPRIYLPYLKSMSIDDRNAIEVIYNLLSDISILSLDLEIDYSEKKESDLINDIFKKWQSAKPLFRKILANMRKPSAVINKKEKSYFG